MAILTAKVVLVYLTNRYKHNWDKIFDHIHKKKPAPPAVEMLEYLEKHKINCDNWVTILDPEFPELLKHIRRPPFALDTTTESFRYISEIHKLLESTEGINEDETSDANL